MLFCAIKSSLKIVVMLDGLAAGGDLTLWPVFCVACVQYMVLSCHLDQLQSGLL